MAMNAVPEFTFTMLPPPWDRIMGMTACMATIGPSTLRWKISSKSAGSISSIAAAVTAPGVVDETVDAAVVPVHVAQSGAQMVKVRHVRGDGQTALKLLRQFFQGIA